MSLAVMVCFARSGGTLLNRCLGSLEGTVVMSEVNPTANSHTSIRVQSAEWYNVTLPDAGFVDTVAALESAVGDSKLVLRDWTFVDFMPCRANGFNPAGTFGILEALRPTLTVDAFVFVRDGIDVWISMGQPDLETFFGAYLDYAERLVDSDMPVFRYEDFCANPGRLVRDICAAAKIPFSETWRDYANFTTVWGDTSATTASARSGPISVQPRKPLPAIAVGKVDACEEMRRANELLGYPTSYAAGASILQAMADAK